MQIQRDDLIAGGSKRRGLDLLLPTVPYNNIAYAGTIFGHGALALALACEAIGKTAHLYLSCNDGNHPMIENIRKTNAVIERCEPLPVEKLYTEIRADYIFPLAFDTPAFHEAMVRTLREMALPEHSEIWCASVSGTFAKALKAAFPDKPIKIVSVVKGGNGNFIAPEKYHQPAKLPPPYPSCPYTDAKIWQFAQKHAAPDALIWNIAG
ncbi:MAG: hypothetical protein DI551_07735 [Micavibrio aeruginosavorus]|uniref:Tryptophan synthase beta chain-like PALP domain-containing protein n=1 Tax=Micavibrio aeruginosavorus TaxID=349221 RepID=A0A2W5PL28_9BACT|nr:MAG: hypothetical protein DI551_07735 [Micavibrio aeruginosavorus]